MIIRNKRKGRENSEGKRIFWSRSLVGWMGSRKRKERRSKSKKWKVKMKEKRSKRKKWKVKMKERRKRSKKWKVQMKERRKKS